MRYRLTVITIVTSALAGTALLFAFNRSEEPSAERGQTEFFPDGMGIVAAFTATAEAGGAALDPTAIATPVSSRVVPDSGSTAEPEATSTSGTSAPSPVLRLSTDEASPGDTVTLGVSGAAPGESFEIALDGNPVAVSPSNVDPDGNASIELTVSTGVTEDSVELVFEGSESGSSSITITISSGAPSVSVSPQQAAPGSSITITAEGFEPGEQVTIRISGTLVGSGFAGQDGTFSITTGLPDLPDSGSGSQALSVEGASGTVASTEFGLSESAAVQPTATQPAQSGSSPGTEPANEDPGASDKVEDASEQPGGSTEKQSSGSGAALPAWLYVALGLVAGWLLVLTAWVIRLDRRRDGQSKAFLTAIARLLIEREVRGARDAEGSGVSPDAADRAA